VVHVQFDVFPLVIDTDERIETSSFECCRSLLPDDVLEVLIFAGDLGVNIEIPVIYTLDLNEHR